jgi:predicted DNA-binding protein
MTTRVATFPLRLPVSLKAALEKISERDGTSINQFLVVAAAEKVAVIETEDYFLTHRNRAVREFFRRILSREGGEAPHADDEWNEGGAASAQG